MEILSIIIIITKTKKEHKNEKKRNIKQNFKTR